MSRSPTKSDWSRASWKPKGQKEKKYLDEKKIIFMWFFETSEGSKRGKRWINLETQRKFVVRFILEDTNLNLMQKDKV